jgi:hypothetical protein
MAACLRDALQELQLLFGRPNQQIRTTPEGLFALVDVVMLVTGKNCNDANKVVRALLRAHPEVKDNIHDHQFPGRGQKKIATAKVDTVIQVVMLLPGASAAAGRVLFSQLIRSLSGVAASSSASMAAGPQDSLAVREHAHSADALQELQLRFGRPNQQIRTTPQGFLALVDVVMMVTGKDLNHAGSALRDLFEVKPELHRAVVYFKFPGRGQRKIPTAKVDTVIQVVMLLPGAAAAAGRVSFSQLIRRYVAGDQTMHAEIDANRAAQEVIAHIPEEQRTPTQQLAAACAAETRAEHPPGQQPPLAVELRVFPQPEVLETPRKERDLYCMGVLPCEGEGRLPENRVVYKIGRSDDALQRAKSCDSEVRRFHDKSWTHQVLLIFRGCGAMEHLLLDEFAPPLDGFTEHFSGDASFVGRFVEAVQRLVPTMQEKEYQKKRRAEESLKSAEDRGVEADHKRRRIELDLRREEIELMREEAVVKAEARKLEIELRKLEVQSEADVLLIRTRAEVEARRIRAGVAAPAIQPPQAAPHPRSPVADVDAALAHYPRNAQGRLLLPHLWANRHGRNIGKLLRRQPHLSARVSPGRVSGLKTEASTADLATAREIAGFIPPQCLWRPAV